MVIYADVLVFVNSIVDYFLLLLTSRLNKVIFKRFRLVLGALSGGLSSLYIFLPVKNVIIDCFFKIVFSVLMVLISFGFKNLKYFCGNVFYLFASSFIYAGVILGIWQIFKSDKIFIKNSTVYYDVSVIFLLISTVLIYVVITVVGSIVKKSAISAEKSNIILRAAKTEISLNAIYDTGNSICDIFGDKETVLTDKKHFEKISENLEKNEMEKRFRVTPCKTVSGSSVLNGIRCDILIVSKNGREYRFENPILYQSNTDFDGEFNAILNPEILTKMR